MEECGKRVRGHEICPRQPRLVADPRAVFRGTSALDTPDESSHHMLAMSCQELTDRLHDYRGGDVGRADREALEAHLMICDHCLRYACDYEVTIRLARSTDGRGARPRLQSTG